MIFLKRITILVLKKIDLGSAIAVRLTKITHKSKVPLHPKHFLHSRKWYTEHITGKDSVLDLGCGNGQSAINAARIARKVVAIDIDDRLLDIAKRSARELKIRNIKFLKKNLENGLQFQNNLFDRILFLDVFEHLNNRKQILKEIYRILKPSGLLFIGVPNSQTSWKKMQRSVGLNSYSDPDHKIEFSEDQITNLLKKHGFKIEKLGYGVYDTPLRGLIDVIGGLSLSLYKSLSMWRKNKAKLNPQEASGFEIICSVLK